MSDLQLFGWDNQSLSLMFAAWVQWSQLCSFSWCCAVFLPFQRQQQLSCWSGPTALLNQIAVFPILRVARPFRVQSRTLQSMREGREGPTSSPFHCPPPKIFLFAQVFAANHETSCYCPSFRAGTLTTRNRFSHLANRCARLKAGLHVRRKHKHKHKHQPRVNRDDASTSARKRNARLCLRMRRSGSRVACAYACVVRVNQPLA